MRRLLLAITAAFFFLPSIASAQELWRMDAFRADIMVRRDGIVEVRETIKAEFLSERHGIFRYLPVAVRDDEGRPHRLGVTLKSVTRDGKSEKAVSYREGDNLVWKIGRADVTMRGKHEYVLVYEVRGAIGRFEDHDELYWNVTGHGWDVPLPNAAAVVMLPEGVEATGSICYTGPYGSTESDCQIIESSGQVGFVAGTGKALTVVVGWPKGEVSEPAGDRLGAVLVGLIVFFERFGGILAYLIPVFVLFLMYRIWKRSGDDPDLGAIVTQYGPPDDFGPAETLAILRRGTDRADVTTTIIDLAARGYLRLTELPDEDYLFESLQPRETWKDLKPFESELLDGLFPGETITQRKLSELKNRFYRNVSKFRNGVMDRLITSGYFPRRQGRSPEGWVFMGIVLAVGGLMAISGPLRALAYPLLATGAIVAGFGSQMGRWTEKGAVAAAHAMGFKEFITKVEKYRAPWMEERGVIERLLPYAIGFGLGKKWVETFSTLLQQPPDWYRGASMATWSPDALSDDLTRFGKTFTRVSISQPAPKVSSGSGFGGGGRSGGGGFSGGGRGGGGGGSW